MLILVTILGSVMYLVEGPRDGFRAIPRSMYWAIVTMTTVGYGDIAPQTVAGKMLASTVMILGYGIIAVPTGIVASEMTRVEPVSTQHCRTCGKEGHDVDAKFCKACGSSLAIGEAEPVPAGPEPDPDPEPEPQLDPPPKGPNP